MNVLLLHLDGSLPNLALMRVAAYHKRAGDGVTLRKVGNVEAVEPRFFDDDYGRVYASTIFERTRPVARRVLEVYPNAIVGGTGWDLGVTLESVGIETLETDYSIYPTFAPSIGFSQRGCRLRCPFCVVPAKEGRVRHEQTIAELWRGEPHARELLLLDNDFFGQAEWRDRIAEIRDGRFKVSFSQGINARLIDDEIAAAVASVRYFDDGMKRRRIYTAWDGRRDEERLFAGLGRLVAAGVARDSIMVYMLVGYEDGGLADWEYRRSRLREFGVRPYPMPYVRTPETVGFQRWVIGAYDRRIPWSAWERTGYAPRRLGRPAEPVLWGA